MKLADFPQDLQNDLIPRPGGRLVYHCLGCERTYEPDALYYTCPDCGGVFLIEDTEADRLSGKSGAEWRRLFDHRRMLNHPALKGVFLFHEFLAPLVPLEDVVYLGEGHTPVVEATPELADRIGARFFFKNDGQNPSASFKDRGMAAALSFIRYLARTKGLDRVLSVCASTGDTSAAAALYAGHLPDLAASAVLLPQGKVTPQQLGQPLGSGAAVFELPGVFDDCMKVVEHLSEHYEVALLNSKNAWRVLGQESYSFEVCQQFDYEVRDLSLFVPIGNAGNITAVLSGLMKMERFGVIDGLPRVFGVQSAHADPVFRYYSRPPEAREYQPVTVRPSVAQAAMIGNPVSMPRVLKLAQAYERRAGQARFFVVQVEEQDIMDMMLTANRRGHVACTQGGESLAGLKKALALGLMDQDGVAVLDSTAHALKFADFQNRYFEDDFGPEFEVRPREELKNHPQAVVLDGVVSPGSGRALSAEETAEYVAAAAAEIARRLGLKAK